MLRFIQMETYRRPSSKQLLVLFFSFLKRLNLILWQLKKSMKTSNSSHFNSSYNNKKKTQNSFSVGGSPQKRFRHDTFSMHVSQCSVFGAPYQIMPDQDYNMAIV